MESMFERSEFNGDISNWDVSNVEHMEYMFAYSKFDQDNISKWNVNNKIDLRKILAYSLLKGNATKWWKRTK